MLCTVPPSATVARQTAFCARVTSKPGFSFVTNKVDPSVAGIVNNKEDAAKFVASTLFVSRNMINWVWSTKTSFISNVYLHDGACDAAMAKKLSLSTKGAYSGTMSNELAFSFKAKLSLQHMPELIKNPNVATTKAMLEFVNNPKSNNQFAMPECQVETEEQASVCMQTMYNRVAEAVSSLDQSNAAAVMNLSKHAPLFLLYKSNWEKLRCAVVALQVIRNAIASDGANLPPISNEKVEIVVDEITGKTMMVPSEIMAEVVSFDAEWAVQKKLNGKILEDMTVAEIKEILAVISHIPAKLAEWLTKCETDLKAAVTAVDMIGCEGGIPINTALFALIADRINGTTETTERNAALLKLYEELEAIVEESMDDMYPTQTKRARSDSVELEAESRSSRVSSRTDEDRHLASDCFGSD